MASVDLVPDNALLTPNFETYKLDNEKFAVVPLDLGTELKENRPSASQYGLQHLLTVNEAEQLIYDPFQTDSKISFYVLLGCNTIATTQFEPRDRTWTPLTPICKLPNTAEIVDEASFPASLMPLPEKTVVACNGVDKVVLVREGETLQTFELEDPGVIVDCRQAGKTIDILVQSVVRRETKNVEAEDAMADGDGGLFSARLTWMQICYNAESNGWLLERRRVMNVDGNLEMATFKCGTPLQPATEIIIMASSPPVMIADSKKEIVVQQPEAELMEIGESTENQERIDGVDAKSEISGDNAHINFNQDQLEDCDISTDRIMHLYWICGESHNLLLQSNISGRQLVFATKNEPNQPRSLCIRHDHDGILWKFNETESRKPVYHHTTFSALGYIQAGKQRRKFTTCSPDQSYAAIIDGKRYAFVYWPEKQIEAQLVQRTGSGQRRVTGVAVQNLISLNATNSMGESEAISDPILGAYAAESALFLMTTKQVFAVILKGLCSQKEFDGDAK